MAMKANAGTPGWQQRHVELYLKTDGAEGHDVDFGRPGCRPPAAKATRRRRRR